MRVKVKSVNDAPPTVQAARSGRSPAYPAFALETAIEKAREFYAAQRMNAVSIESATECLGYKSIGSGTAQRALAALLSYGLLSDEGVGPNRRVHITDLGRRILLLQEDDPERLEAIREAALKPRIYEELVNRYPEHLPTDTEISKFLTFDKNYNEETTRALIRDFRATYNFANLSDRGIIAEELSEKNGSEGNGNDRHDLGSLFGTWNTPTHRNGGQAMNTAQHPPIQNSPPAPPAGMRPYTLPILDGRVAYLYAPADLRDEDFGLLDGSLDLIRRSFGGTAKQADFVELPPPSVQIGPAIWHTKDVDVPIIVAGYLGLKGDRHYASIEGSKGGVPVDEIVYEGEEEPK